MDFTTHPPSVTDSKVWQISKNSTVLTITCNGVVVMEYSDFTCSKLDKDSPYIKFWNKDSASKFYGSNIDGM